MVLRCGVPGRRSVWRHSATRALDPPSTKRSVTRDTQQESVRHALTGRACTTHKQASPRTAFGVVPVTMQVLRVHVLAVPQIQFTIRVQPELAPWWWWWYSFSAMLGSTVDTLRQLRGAFGRFCFVLVVLGS